MKQKIISVAEARKHFAELTSEVAEGKVEYIITKNKKPIAKIASPSFQSSVDAKFMQQLEDFMKRRDVDLKLLADS